MKSLIEFLASNKGTLTMSYSHLIMNSLMISFSFFGCSSKPKSKMNWSEVNQAFKDSQHEKAITNCFQQHKKIKPNAKGQVQVQYSFYGNAKEITIQEISPDLNEENLKKCILTAANKVNLKKAKENAEQEGYELTLEMNRIYSFE